MKEMGLDQLRAWCQGLADNFSDRQIVLLSGPLGAGKTQLVKHFMSCLGAGEVSSPTFSLINQYQHSDKDIYHVDLYRIENDEDLESTGFWDLFSAERGVVFIEWPERMTLADLPRSWSSLKINIEKDSLDEIRRYSCEPL